jgi:hypothetical protein
MVDRTEIRYNPGKFTDADADNLYRMNMSYDFRTWTDDNTGLLSDKSVKVMGPDGRFVQGAQGDLKIPVSAGQSQMIREQNLYQLNNPPPTMLETVANVLDSVSFYGSALYHGGVNVGVSWGFFDPQYRRDSNAYGDYRDVPPFGFGTRPNTPYGPRR